MVSLKQHLFGMMILHDEHHLVQVKRKALKDLKNRGDVIIARGGLGAGKGGGGIFCTLFRGGRSRILNHYLDILNQYIFGHII
jgi:hypothetical protein